MSLRNTYFEGYKRDLKGILCIEMEFYPLVIAFLWSVLMDV